MNKKFKLTVFLMLYNPENFQKMFNLNNQQTYRPFKLILLLDYPKKNQKHYTKVL